MRHLLKRNGKYYYNRRVPDYLKDIDKRVVVRCSLKTDHKDTAIQKCVVINQQVEAYWDSLIKSGHKHSAERFREVVRIARLLGFSYRPVSQLSNAQSDELYNRLKVASEPKRSLIDVEAVLGGVEPVQLMMGEVLDRFWSFTKDRIMNKSKDQIRKWQNPRKKAVTNFLKLVGDKEVKDITRDDILRFRDWWIERVENGMNASTANKDLIHLKNIMQTIEENLRLGIDTDWLFRRVNLKERFSQARKPLDREFIQNVLLNDDNLKGLNKQAKYFLYAMAETGARIAELTGLEKVDIKLDVEIPHIHIRDRSDKPLKTPHSDRTIPLVGYALKAFKACPNGFTQYRGRADSLSTLLNKYLRKHDLLPSKEHSVYSLRHSFQDRLLAANTPDRVQAELMGHKFQRPRYGDGASLEQKKEWMERCLI